MELDMIGSYRNQISLCFTAGTVAADVPGSEYITGLSWEPLAKG